MPTPALTLSMLAVLAQAAAAAPSWPTAPDAPPDSVQSAASYGPPELDTAPFSAPERLERPGRLEHFALVWRGEVVGVSRLRETQGSHGPLFERETQWFDAELRVLEVEEPLRPGPVLVWREIRPGAGRTLVLERRASGALAITDWCGSLAPARRLLDGPPPITPLARLALARYQPSPTHGPQPPAFQPLAAGLQPLERRVTGSRGSGPRWSVWLRPDGSEAERALFLGPVLLARRTARSGPWSLAVDPSRYQELLVEYENRSESAPEGALTKLLPEGPRLPR